MSSNKETAWILDRPRYMEALTLPRQLDHCPHETVQGVKTSKIEGDMESLDFSIPPRLSTGAKWSAAISRNIPTGGRHKHHTTQNPSICNVSEHSPKVHTMCHIVLFAKLQVPESGSHSEPLGCTTHAIIVRGALLAKGPDSSVGGVPVGY